MGMRAPANSGFAATARGDRIDWRAVRDTISLADVATRLLGSAPGRRGERSARRLWWSCPFHEDRNPSFCIKQDGRQWRCWGCGMKGDVIELVRRLNPGWTFPEAVTYLTGQPLPSAGHSKPSLNTLETPGRRPGPALDADRPGRREAAGRADRVAPGRCPGAVR